jgi:hypothetical protein
MPPPKREPGDSNGAGEGLGLDGRARASYLRLQNPRYRSSACPARSRKAIRRDSKWWTTSSSSQDTPGELLRANRGDNAEEDISDRVKPSPSREAVEAVSIHRSSRKLSCEGGGVTRRVT